MGDPIFRGWLAKYRRDNFSGKLNEAKRQIVHTSLSNLQVCETRGGNSFSHAGREAQNQNILGCSPMLFTYPLSDQYRINIIA
jgi:hypothetical protein